MPESGADKARMIAHRHVTTALFKARSRCYLPSRFD